jgi:hypothetical protein
MSGVEEIFALGDADALRDMLNAAAFEHIEIRSVSMTSRFPNPEGFLEGEITVDTASIPSMQRMGAQERQEIIAAIRDDMEGPLRDVTQNGHVLLPFHALIAHAS